MVISGKVGPEIWLGAKATLEKSDPAATDVVIGGILESDFEHHWPDANRVTCTINLGEPAYVVFRLAGL